MLKKAMIMAAGVGSRLEPLSSIVPKPLVPLANVPAMDILIKHLSSFGIKDIIANTFYKAEDIIEHYNQNNLGMNIRFIQEKTLSGTAGGVKKCQFFFDKDEDFIVMSGDGLTDIDIKAAYEAHVKSNAIATVILKEIDYSEVNKYGIVVPNKNGLVQSFQEKPSLIEAKSNLANTGIYIFKYDIFNYIPENTFYDFAKNVFPSLINKNIKINTYIMEGYWSDIGSLSSYHQSNIDLLKHTLKNYKPEIITTKEGGIYTIGKMNNCENNFLIEGACIIGSNCEIGRNTRIINSIIWDNVKISDNLIIENSIILSNTIIEKPVRYQIVKENELKEHTAVMA